MNFLTRIGLLSLLAMVSLTAMVPQPSYASPTPFHSVELNIHGVYIGALTYSASTLHPLNMMAEEVCGSAFTPLHDALVAQGYTVRSYRAVQHASGSSSCTPNDSMYNVVASGGTTAPGDAWAVQYPDQAPHDLSASDPTRGDYRGFVCMRSSYILRVWLSCASHMSGKSDPAPNGTVYADMQGSFVMAFMSGFFPSIPQMLGTDFNRFPCRGQSHGGPFDFYWAYREADEVDSQQICPSPDPRYTFKPAQTKIDYIWVTRSMTLDYFGVAQRKCDQASTGSDHCYYHGAFQWP